MLSSRLRSSPIVATTRGWAITYGTGGKRGVPPSVGTLPVVAMSLMAPIITGALAAIGARAPAIGLWAVAAQAPDGGRSVFALLVATLVGTLAWLAATIVAKPSSPRDSRDVLRAGLALTLLAPAMAPLLILPIGIAAVERRPVLGMTAVAALAFAMDGQAVCATLALIAACTTLLSPARPIAANDNGWTRPLPYLP